MSDVTDVLLTCELTDDTCYEWVARRFVEICDVAEFVRVDGLAVGHKNCQAVVALAAVNGWGIYEDEFLLAMRERSWRFPDAVRVFVHRENADGGFVELPWR